MTWFHEVLSPEQHAARQREQQLTDEQKARAAAAAQAQAQNAAWSRIEAQEAAWRRDHERAATQAEHLQRGRELLGLVEHQGVWRARYPEQTSGLPYQLVDQARQAVQAEWAAWQALERAHNAALAYCQQHQLSGEAARVKIELARAEPMTAYNAARQAADRACQTLGDVAAQIAAARAELAQLPAEQRSDDQQHHTRKVARENRMRDLRAQLARHGLAE